jgi:phage head maturation protease
MNDRDDARNLGGETVTSLVINQPQEQDNEKLRSSDAATESLITQGYVNVFERRDILLDPHSNETLYPVIDNK